jgi:hypothetical protein
VLDRYRVETLVLDEEYHARTGLLERVKQSTQWSRTFTAGPAIVFQRSSAHVTLTRALTTRV